MARGGQYEYNIQLQDGTRATIFCQSLRKLLWISMEDNSNFPGPSKLTQHLSESDRRRRERENDSSELETRESEKERERGLARLAPDETSRVSASRKVSVFSATLYLAHISDETTVIQQTAQHLTKEINLTVRFTTQNRWNLLSTPGWNTSAWLSCYLRGNQAVKRGAVNQRVMCAELPQPSRHFITLMCRP
ncbi:hypothetical protein MHYP_G00347940 [Metynnis hypsauchen]